MRRGINWSTLSDAELDELLGAVQAERQRRLRLRLRLNNAENIPEIVAEAVAVALMHEERLEAFGFQCDEFGQWRLQGECRIILYRVGGTWELDIILPNGSAIGGDLPCDKLVGRTAAEIAAVQPPGPLGDSEFCEDCGEADAEV